MRHRPPQGTGQVSDLERMRLLLGALSAVCAQDGVTVESAAPDAIDGVSPRLLAATRAGSPAGEPILLRSSGGREVIAVVDGQGHSREIWESIRVRAARLMIRRRIQRDDLAPGLTAVAVSSGDRITVFVSEAIPARLQRAGGRDALQAARRAGWTGSSAPAASLLFAAGSVWRAALGSGARRFAVAGSTALILVFTVGAVLTAETHPPPVRAVITPVTPGTTPHVRGATKGAADSPGDAGTRRPGRARVVAHRQPQGASGRTARPAPSGGKPTAVTSTPTGSSPTKGPSSSPDPSPSPSPSRTKHCILIFC